MPHYKVHIYREMRLVFEDIEAETPQDAARQAREMHFDDADDWSDCEGETLAALVDRHGDEDYSESYMIDFEPARRIEAVPALEQALLGLLDAASGLPLPLLPGPFHEAVRVASAALANCKSDTLRGAA